MSKKNKIEYILQHKILFVVDLTDYSSSANTHNVRAIKRIFKDIGVDYEVYTYYNDGSIETAFYLDIKHKSLVKEICEKFEIGSCITMFQDRMGKYACFQDDIDSNKSKGVGWIEKRSKAECEAKMKYYFYDDKGNYFIIGKQGTIITIPEEKIAV